LVVERFSQSVINSGIFRLYTATGFFATLIFFVLNSDLYTPLEMTFWVVAVTVCLKGISNMMLSMIILMFNLENKQAEMDFKYNADKIESMLAELQIKESEIGKEQEKKS
jgi:phosphotransferase system  glucose/maltose/N-acetylglucosamine-specific IIC component